MLGGGTNNGGIGGARLFGLDAKELPCDRGRGTSTWDFRSGDERIPAGSDATGRCSRFRAVPAVRGRPLWSTDGRGPNFTFGGMPAARSRSRSEGRADWVDIRTSSDGRGNSSKMLRYFERPELESGDLEDMVLVCDSLGLPREGGARELPRDGGGRRSGEGFSSGETVGGTTVASDL